MENISIIKTLYEIPWREGDPIVPRDEQIYDTEVSEFTKVDRFKHVS